MRASRVDLLLVLCLALGMSGCYGCCGGYPSPYGGYGAACGGYPDYGYGACGYPDYGSGAYGYGGYGAYGNGPYGDCVDGGGAYYGYGGGDGPHGGRDRLSLRERLMARREARGSRRDGREHGRHGRRHGRHGEFSCDGCGGDCCCSDMGCCGDCGSCCCADFCCGDLCCDSSVDCCLPMSSCCGDCGPCMDCSSSWQGAGGCETCNTGVTSASAPTCAGGTCALGSKWGDTSGTFVPYSHEAYPGEPAPHPIDGAERESLPVPPTNSDVEEGLFGPAKDDTSVIRGPQASAGVRQTQWVPPRF